MSKTKKPAIFTICQNPECGKEFQVKPATKGLYCSSSCAAKINNRGRIHSEQTKDRIRQKRNILVEYNKIHNIVVPKTNTIPNIISNCYICNSIIYIKINKTSKTICSDPECKKQHCSIAGRRSAQVIVRRSKDEIKLFNLCNINFNNVESNFIIENNWDADIVFQDYKIAILWNGPWHYRIMPLQNHSLKQVKNRDKIKRRLFKSLGWKVLIFEDRYWTPETAFNSIKNLVGRLGFEPRTTPFV